MGYLVLTNKIKDAALDCSSRGTGWLRMADSSLSVVCLQMQGMCDVKLAIIIIVHLIYFLPLSLSMLRPTGLN